MPLRDLFISLQKLLFSPVFFSPLERWFQIRRKYKLQVAATEQKLTGDSLLGHTALDSWLRELPAQCPLSPPCLVGLNIWTNIAWLPCSPWLDKHFGWSRSLILMPNCWTVHHSSSTSREKWENDTGSRNTCSDYRFYSTMICFKTSWSDFF